MSPAAAPDGYTLVLAFDGTMVINPHVLRRCPSTPSRTSRRSASRSATRCSSSWRTRPSRTSGSGHHRRLEGRPEGHLVRHSGIGGTPHRGRVAQHAHRLEARAHPYKGGGQAMADALGGNIPLVYTVVAGAFHAREGRQAPRGGGVPRCGARRRSRTCPPSSRRACRISRRAREGILAPAKTPRPIIDRLSRELSAVLTTPEIVARLETLGITATPGTPEQFGEQMRRDLRSTARS
ncbi:MAG: hypothetical protein IPL06_18610 [Betaproteobacteria bacterium]|nr:hypothetical protein [Betaproteobacteria bacterium]